MSLKDDIAGARRVAMSVTFRRWTKRKPWTCRHCGAHVEDPRAHASWHAALEAGARSLPPDPGVTERRPKELVVHIAENGWPL